MNVTGFGYDYAGVEAERRLSIDLAMNLTGVVVSAVLNLQACQAVLNLEPSFWINLTGTNTPQRTEKTAEQNGAERK